MDMGSFMAMIDIEYRHSSEPDSEDIRRPSIEDMCQYLKDLVFEMQMADISSKMIDTESDGKNMVLINGKDVFKILEGLEIKMLDSDDSCDHGKVNIVRFDRPTLDWKKEYIEDIPDTLMKNAIAKIYADVTKNRIL